jgi:vancomycin aglycone glucosyltransferase
MSRIVITAIGTRGDVGPGIFLARRLAGGVAGGRREVVLVAPPENESAVRGASVDFMPIGTRFSDVVARGNLAEYREQIRLQFREHLDLYKSADLLVGISLFYAGRSIAEHLGLPYRHVFFTPQVFRSPSTTPPSARRMSRSHLVNNLLWQRHLAQEDFIVGRILNDERAQLGLRPLRHAADGRTGPGTVLAVDPLFARLPEDLVPGGAGIRQAHYWNHGGEDLALDPETARFLDAGEPPILVSFGSADLVMKDTAATYARLCETLTGCGHRVLLVSPRPIAGDFSGSVHRADFLPHANLMPRCSMVIHHGGIGTVFAAARAGIPQLVVPRMLDQFFWAARVGEMQIGYGPLPVSDLTSPMIGQAVARLLADELVAQRVREIADALASPARAVEVDAVIRDIFSVSGRTR